MLLRYDHSLSGLLIMVLLIPMFLLADQPAAKSADDRPWLGVYLGDYASETAKSAHRAGALVQEVIENSPAARAGLRKGDILIKMQNKAVRDADNVIQDLGKMKPGDEVALTVLRDGKEKAVKVKLANYPEAKRSVQSEKKTRPEKALKVKMPEKFIFSLGTSRLGVRVQEMDEDLASYFNLKAGEGVLVTEVEEESPAQKAGLKSGDVITAVNGAKTGTPEALREEIRDLPEDKTAEISYLRKGALQKAQVQLEQSDAYYVPMGPRHHLPDVNEKAIQEHVQKMREEFKKSREEGGDHRFYWDVPFGEKEALRESFKTEMEQLKKELKRLKEEMNNLKKELSSEIKRSH